MMIVEGHFNKTLSMPRIPKNVSQDEAVSDNENLSKLLGKKLPLNS